MNDTAKHVLNLEAENARLRSLLGSWVDLVDYALQGRDHDDFFPWTFTTSEAVGKPHQGWITTPNGPRSDGSMHTYWMIAGDVWEPTGRLIVEAVNAAAEAARTSRESVIVQPVVPEDGDPAPDVGPDPVVLPRATTIVNCSACGAELTVPTERDDQETSWLCGLACFERAIDEAVKPPVVLPRAAVCNNWERWTEDE